MVTISIVVICGILAFLPKEWFWLTTLSFQDHQYWRLMTQNFVHSGAVHFAYDLIGFAIVGYLLESRISRTLYIFIIVAIGLLNSLIFLLSALSAQALLGLSAIQQGLLSSLGIVLFLKRPKWLGMTILALQFVKIAGEFFTIRTFQMVTSLLSTTPQGSVCERCHLVGALVGIIVTLSAVFFKPGLMER